MRRIDKTEIFATVYMSWLESLNGNHPIYNSSNGKYYYDIIANLIWVQKGLCAYTEQMLISPDSFSSENWNNGIYPKFSFKGELDHYNPSLKEIEGWSWGNFFLIDSDINSNKVKGSKKPNEILKPDKADYDPFYFLDYNFEEHCFLPNKERDWNLQRNILNDINILGLNFKAIVDIRKKYLNNIISDVRFGLKTIEIAKKELYQYYTAFEMSIKQLKFKL